jgi:hypothetical protein
MHFNEPGIIQDTEMFRSLRLLELEALGDFTYCEGAVTQKLDNVIAVGLSKRT